MLGKLILRIFCMFNQHINSTYYKCFECGKYLKLDGCMSLRHAYLKEIDFSFDDLYGTTMFYGLPYRFSMNSNSYYELREQSRIDTIQQCMMYSRNKLVILIF